MNLQIESNKPTVSVIDDENILSFEFTSYDKNYLINQSDSNIRLLLKKQTVANLNISENLLEINFEKIISYIQLETNVVPMENDGIFISPFIFISVIQIALSLVLTKFPNDLSLSVPLFANVSHL